MKFEIHPTSTSLGLAAAEKAAELLRTTIATKGNATFVAATGQSQFDFLTALIKQPDIDWSKTTMFHLDEYLNLPVSHPASFRRYLQERLISQVQPGTVHLIDGEQPQPEAECQRLNDLIRQQPVDLLFAGIGENGHLAFNDPPADFEIEAPYIVVELDEACRAQQLGEGWFETLSQVPTHAISMSIRQILKANHIICVVPEQRKAQAVFNCFSGEVSPLYPASILRTHEQTTVYLDPASASLLPPTLIS
jgi:glucosamine-6-phosphate deaminase